MTGYMDRIYLTTNSSVDSKYGLLSVGADDIPTFHGQINGDLIQINPVTGSVIAAQRGTSPASVYRYAQLGNGTVEQMDASNELGANASDIAISVDGQMAISMGSGNGEGYSIYDLEPGDLAAANGAWMTDTNPKSAEFSPSGALFGATNSADLMVFDSKRHVLLAEYDVDESACGLGTDSLFDVKFSADGLSVLAKLVCGPDAEKTALFFYPIPDEETPSPAPELTQDEIAEGEVGEHYLLNESGDYHAESATSVYLADQTNNRIVHLDITTSEELNSYELNARPKLMKYVEASNSLYISFEVAKKLVKLDLATGDITEIETDGAVLSIAEMGPTVFYTTRAPLLNFNLYKLDALDAPEFLGLILGDLIEYNPTTNELMAVATGFTPGNLS